MSAHRVSGFGPVSAVTDWHRDLLKRGVRRRASWVDVYGSHESAAFAARMILARLERRGLVPGASGRA